MKQLAVAVSVCMTILIYVNAYAEEDNQKELDASILIRNLITSQMDILKMGDLGDEDECIITNPELENILRDFSRLYEGSNDRRAIARTIDTLIETLSQMYDADGNDSLSHIEVHEIAKLSQKSNAINMLICLSIAYVDVPRQTR